MDGATIWHNKTLLQISLPPEQRICNWDVPPIDQSREKTKARLGATTFLPTAVRNDAGKSWLMLIPTPWAVLKGRSGLPAGLTKPALALHLLGFYKEPDLLLLTLTCLARAAENQ